MSLNTAYFGVVANGMAVCAAKITVVHMLTVRERLMSGQFVQSVDSTLLSPIATVFKTLMGCFGPSLGGEPFIARCERIAKNVAENETIFFLLAMSYGLMNPPQDGKTQTATQLVQIYTGARVAHTLVYLTNFELPTKLGLRGVSYIVGTLCGVSLVGLVATAKK